MKTEVELSIIVVSHNTKTLLEHCLDSIVGSLTAHNLRYELIIVDNASRDGSCEMVRSRFPQFHLIENITNAGFGKSNNQGIRFAVGETILLLNSDTEVLDKGIEKLYHFFLGLKPEAIVGGKLFDMDRTPQPSCGPAYTLPMIFTALFLKGDYRGLTRYSPDETRQVDWVMGACMMAAKKTFMTIPFDERIFMYMDEIDLQYRAKDRGVAIYFYPQAHFVHVGAGSSLGRATPILNVFKGFLFYYKKHFSPARIFVLRLILISKSVCAIILFTLLGRPVDRNIYQKALKISLT